jgi:hypothetical protein
VTRLRHPTKAAVVPAVEEEKDTMEAEDKFDLNALLLPDGTCPAFGCVRAWVHDQRHSPATTQARSDGRARRG